MVHNGIEYGLMAAYAEGLNILRKRANIGLRRRTKPDAETAPRCRTRSTTATISTCRMSPKYGGAAACISSWLLDLTCGRAACRNPGP